VEIVDHLYKDTTFLTELYVRHLPSPVLHETLLSVATRARAHTRH
jgi:hypothetical protein